MRGMISTGNWTATVVVRKYSRCANVISVPWRLGDVRRYRVLVMESAQHRLREHDRHRRQSIQVSAALLRALRRARAVGAETNSRPPERASGGTQERRTAERPTTAER